MTNHLFFSLLCFIWWITALGLRVSPNTSAAAGHFGILGKIIASQIVATGQTSWSTMDQKLFEHTKKN